MSALHIRVLPASVAAQIAAGEVVERPASVVKELVENSLDAGASAIRIEVRDGGLTSIRVVDNGSGIAAEELELAFERHATSKLASAEDLHRIATLGFRGEALPSIAAVADIYIVSRPADQQAGAFLRLEGGGVIRRGRAGAPVGTDITVSNLFARQPARRQFLRSATAEGQQIASVVSSYALARPDVRFTLSLNGRLVLQTEGNGALRDSAAAVYGIDVASNLVDIIDSFEHSQSEVRVGGLTSPPALSRASRSYISLFVNGRWVQNRSLVYAVAEAYQDVLPSGRYPLAILTVRLPPEAVDVNVHPAKTQVRFRRENDVFTAVQRAVRRALNEAAPVPTLRQRLEAPLTATATDTTTRQTELTLPSVWQGARRPQQPAPPANADVRPVRSVPILRVIGQVSNTYIIAEGPDGLYLIDQHAAHERVLYEQLCQSHASQAVPLQGLLEPLLFEPTATQRQLIASCWDTLLEHGFQIEEFGQQSYLIRAVPAVLAGRDIQQSVSEFLDLLLSSDGSRDQRDRVAMSLACHGSVRAGKVLTIDEMKELIRQLEATEWPRTCPHGRPTMISMNTALLEREFGRR